MAYTHIQQQVDITDFRWRASNCSHARLWVGWLLQPVHPKQVSLHCVCFVQPPPPTLAVSCLLSCLPHTPTAGPKGEGGLEDATGASGAAGGASYKQTSRATQLSKQLAVALCLLFLLLLFCLDMHVLVAAWLHRLIPVVCPSLRLRTHTC